MDEKKIQNDKKTIEELEEEYYQRNPEKRPLSRKIRENIKDRIQEYKQERKAEKEYRKQQFLAAKYAAIKQYERKRAEQRYNPPLRQNIYQQQRPQVYTKVRNGEKIYYRQIQPSQQKPYQIDFSGQLGSIFRRNKCTTDFGGQLGNLGMQSSKKKTKRIDPFEKLFSKSRGIL